MSESTLQIIAFLKIIWLAIFALCYGWGGMEKKWLRRYLGTFIYVAGLCGFAVWVGTFNWWLLAMYPLMVGATTWGYGADGLFDRLWHRFVQGGLFGLAAIPVAIVSGNPLMFAAHCFTCVTFCVFFGTVNPVQARSEESLIGIGIGLMPIFMV